MKLRTWVLFPAAVTAMAVAGSFLWASSTGVTSANEEKKPVTSARLNECRVQEDGVLYFDLEFEVDGGYEVGWTVSHDCELTLVEAKPAEDKAGPKEIRKESIEQANSLLACKDWAHQMYYRETPSGADQTQYWSYGNWCYDGSAVTWWQYPADFYPGAINGWQFTHNVMSNGWVTNPTHSYVQNQANYVKAALTHYLQGRSNQRANGLHQPCNFAAAGSFPGSNPGVWGYCSP